MIYNVLGLMSGTSLDGLDMALCAFNDQNFSDFEIIKTKTVSFPDSLTQKIKNVLNLSVLDFIELHKKFGTFVGYQINENFSAQTIDLIASHGHTVVHFPEKNVNFQIGDGATIAAITELPVVSDFRSNDIALSGQGAPLVPAGEKYLFPDFDTFLNIGGFSNVSFWRNQTIAFDISPANYALNYFSNKLGSNFDFNGNFGKQGVVNPELFNELSDLDFFRDEYPKSLSDHWFFDVFLPIVDKYDAIIFDKMRTIYELIAVEIGKNLDAFNTNKVMITGGGAHNKFLIDLINENSKAEVFIPDNEIVNFKEAIIFAFLGFLRFKKIPNCLSSVTGAKFDNIGGAIYQVK